MTNKTLHFSCDPYFLMGLHTETLLHKQQVSVSQKTTYSQKLKYYHIMYLYKHLKTIPYDEIVLNIFPNITEITLTPITITAIAEASIKWLMAEHPPTLEVYKTMNVPGVYDQSTNRFELGYGGAPHADCICRLLGFYDVSDFNTFVYEQSKSQKVSQDEIFKKYDNKILPFILIGSSMDTATSYNEYVKLSK